MVSNPNPVKGRPWVRRWSVCLSAAWCLATAMPSQAAEWRVLPAGDPTQADLMLRAWWSEATPDPMASPAPAKEGATTRHPVVVLLHGCGGMLDKDGQPTVRMKTYAKLLNAQGWHTLAVDSLTPRGETELCTQRSGTRLVTMTQRRADALAALQWLATQPGVDPQRLALLGWSNGGSALLASTNLQQPDVVKARAQLTQMGGSLKLAVAFYPGCAAEARRGYQPWSPTLLLLGLADDWTPARQCLPLGKSPQVHIQTWEGANHGFDGTGPVVHRKDVPNGAHPGEGVHVGGHPVAREEARAALLKALTGAFGN